MVLFAYYDSPFGLIKIGYKQDSVVSILCTSRRETGHCPSPLSDLAAAQLLEYLEGKRTAFDFPISPEGTPFQISVWHALLDIPYGQTRSYKDIAAAIGSRNAYRAVGMACKCNPLWIVIPCHRVVGNGNSLTGYAGGLDMKRSLLELEKNTLSNFSRAGRGARALRTLSDIDTPLGALDSEPGVKF